MEENLELGPGGYPGEAEFIVNTGDGKFSMLTGMRTIDPKTFNWDGLPKVYESLLNVWQGESWLPKFYFDPVIGMLFIEFVGDTPMWMATPTKGSNGKRVTDMSRMKQFKFSEYMSAMEYLESQA